MKSLRNRLIRTALAWERRFGVAPQITSALSELDAALLVDCKQEQYAKFMKEEKRTAVSPNYDFEFHGIKYQVKANRESGKPGSKVTLVSKAKKYEWDKLIWIHYDKYYRPIEARMWGVKNYKKYFLNFKRLGPKDMKKGKKLELKFIK